MKYSLIRFIFLIIPMINHSSPLQVTSGGTGVTTLTGYALIAGGTISTGPMQSLVSTGTSGQLLTSNGSEALPTFQTLPLPTSAFGELLTVEPSAIIQLQFTYNINSESVNALTGTTTTGSGTVTHSAPFAVLSTTAAINSSAILLSKDRLHYQPGQGCASLFTAVFTTGVANSTQLIGVGNLNSNTTLTFANISDGLFFGYSGATFGIFRYFNGSATFVAQASWNEDTFNGNGASGVTLDPTKGNVYKLQYQWLGFGAIQFFIENPSTGEFVLAHTIQYANANTTTSLLNPTVQLLAGVSNTTNNSNIVLKVPSFAGIIQGLVNSDHDIRHSVTNGFPGATNVSTANFNNILTIRNNATFAGVTNQVVIYPEFFTYFTSAGSESIITFFLNPTFGTALTYSSINAATSVVNYSTTTSVITGGTQLFTFFEIGGTSFSLNLFNQGILLNPGDVLVLAAQTLSGTNTAYASLSWSERF